MMISKFDAFGRDWNKPTVRGRVIVALAVGAISYLAIATKLRNEGPYAYALDFTPHWRAADAMIRGYSPYDVVNGFSRLYPFGAGYLNMLPAALILLPFGYLDPQVATAIFTGIGATVFAFAVTRDGYWRLPFLASAPFVYSVRSGQTVPLMVATMLLPSLGWLAPIKFTTGLAGWAYSLSARYALLALTVISLSIVAFPWWPAQWWHERHDLAAVYYHVPMLLPGGFLTLAALLRWRRREARLIVALSAVPQTMFYYDQLPLLLVARSYRQALVMSVASWLPIALLPLLHGNLVVDRSELFRWVAPLIIGIYYVPCVLLVFARANAGRLPARMERLIGALPSWLRGTAEEATSVG